MLNKIIRFSIGNKLIIGILTIGLAIWGVWSAGKLPIDAVPDITNNQVQIITVCPTLAGQEVEQLVTFPVEQSIANIPDIEEIRSISRFGLSVVTVVFNDDVDIYFARQLINERLQFAVEEIPKGIGTPEMGPVSTGLGEVYQYIIHPQKGSEKKYDAKDLRTMQDWIVARQLYGTPGIVEVNSFGGELKEYEVAVNPYRLKAMDISIPEIFTALEQNNQNTGGAYIDKRPNAYFIRGIGMATSLEDVKRIPIKTAGGVPIFISDVAEVRFGNAIRYGALTYNGEVDAVGGVVMMLKGENSNEVVKRIKEKLPVIQKSLPDDVVIEPYLDRTNLVNRAISTVEQNLIEGALIVIFVLILFLGNLRAGLIVASAIPLSMLFALGMMRVFGVSANLMSLGAIDFGLIVDGAVIIVEATLHHLQMRKSNIPFSKKEMDEEVFLSASGIMRSAMFGIIIILIVYLPVLSLVGIEGKMFKPMAQTVSFAIVGALILSVTYIPMMSALFLPKRLNTRKTISDRMMEALQRFYHPLLTRAIKFKYAVITGAAILFLGSVILFRSMGGEFIPQLQEGDFAFHCILPQGTSLGQSVETAMYASRIIKRFEEVEMVVGKTGSAEVPTDPMPPEGTDLMIILKPKKEWPVRKSYNELADELLDSLEAIPGAFFEKNQPIQMRFNELMTGVRQDVAVKIFGENMDTLADYAKRTSKVIEEVRGATAVQVEKVGGLPQINVEYDRTRIANYGLTIQTVNDVLSTAFAGKKAGLIFENERRFDLVVRLDSAHRTGIEDVSNLMIPTQTGNQVPLSQLAKVSLDVGAAQISREAGRRRIVIGFNVSNRDIQSLVNEIKHELSQKIKLPTGYYFTYGGQFEHLQQATSRLLIAVPVSLLLIFVLLYFTFNSLKQSALIFTAIPLSAIGGVASLWLRDMPFSISAGIGFIALFGVAVLNGIVLINSFNQLEKQGMHNLMDRVLEGTKTRLRPVLITATVASLGFLPMALSTSAGAEVQRPLATVVIGGLVSATFLTLFVLPLLYIIFSTKMNHKSKSVMKTVIVFLIVSLTGMSSTVSAQLPKMITIDDAVSLALKNNNALIANDYSLKAERALKRTAGELPKLNLDAQLGQNNSEQFDQSFQISQSIPFPTIFSARKAFLNSSIKQQEWNKEVEINELTKMVRLSYCEIQYLLYYRAKLNYLDSLYNEFVRIALLRFKTGDAKKIELQTAEAKKGELALLVKQHDVLYTNAYNAFQTLLNTSDSLVLYLPNKIQPLIPSETIDSAMVKQHPRIQLLWNELTLVENNKRVEKISGLPDLTFGYNNQSIIGFQNTTGVEKYFGSGHRFSSFNVGVAVPLSYSATRARMRALDLRKQAVEYNALYQTQLQKSTFQQMVNQYQYDLQQYNYYVQQALPTAQDIIKAGQAGYSTGDVSYVEFLFTLQTATDIELNFLNAVLKLNQSVINLNAIVNK